MINVDDSDKFEKGLEVLGDLLGYQSERPTGSGVPDGNWRIIEDLIYIFEAKSEKLKENPISLDDTKQMKSHYYWAKSTL